MNPFSLIHKFHSSLPAVRDWIEKTLEENRSNAVPVVNFAFSRLNNEFPLDLLNRAKVVVVTGKVPFPPLSRLGLLELNSMEKMIMEGVTYKNTVFISRPHHRKESLHFHELVHVIQWERLGVDRFLLAYGAGLIQFGYRDCPLEKMAYSWQDGFERGVLPSNTVEIIQKETDVIWNSVSLMLRI